MFIEVIYIRIMRTKKDLDCPLLFILISGNESVVHGTHKIHLSN